MLTWLDDFSDWMYTGTLLDYPTADVPSVNVVFETLCLRFLKRPSSGYESASVERSTRFIADLLPFYVPSGTPHCLVTRITPAFGRLLTAEVPTGRDVPFIKELFSERKFVCIDCPPGSFDLGANVEVKALFVRISTMADHDPPGNIDHPGLVRFEEIVGRQGEFSTSRIGWNVMDPDITCDDDDERPSASIFSLLASAKVRLPDLVTRAQEVAANALVYMVEHRNLDHIRRWQKTPAAIWQRQRSKAPPAMTMFDVVEIDCPPIHVISSK